MTNDNRQTEMLASGIMFSLLKKFLEVDFFSPRKMYIDKKLFFIWVLMQLEEPIFPFNHNKQNDGIFFLINISFEY